MTEQERIRELAGRLLSEGKIKYFLGWEDGGDPFSAKPLKISEAGDAEKLVWNAGCVNNMVPYLIDEWKRVPKRGETPDDRPVGICVKGCDSRSMALLIQEHIYEEGEVFVVGLPCKGVADPEKLRRAWVEEGGRGGPIPPDSTVIEVRGDEVEASWDGCSRTFDAEEILMERCKVCRYPNPVVFDEKVGGDVEAKTDVYRDIEEIEGMGTEERWEFWEKEMKRCVRCNACRNVCPACYCKECTVAMTNPGYTPRTNPLDKVCREAWTDKVNSVSENVHYHFSRMYHLVGRCTNCGECDRVCPMDIPLRFLTRKHEKDIRELFDFEAGTSTDPRNLLCEFDENDPGGFIR